MKKGKGKGDRQIRDAGLEMSTLGLYRFHRNLHVPKVIQGIEDPEDIIADLKQALDKV